MQIIIDTEKGLSPADVDVLNLLVARFGGTQPSDTPQALEVEAEKRATPAKKTAAAKKAAPAAPKKAAEPKPQPAPENSSEADSDDLRVQAKAAAKAAMDDGNRDAVVAALSAVGEKRITTMKDENLQAFMGALQVELDLV